MVYRRLLYAPCVIRNNIKRGGDVIYCMGLQQFYDSTPDGSGWNALQGIQEKRGLSICGCLELGLGLGLEVVKS